MNSKNAKPDDEILSCILSADDSENQQIIRAVISRYDNLYPDWEILFLSLPRNDPQERKRHLETAFNLLQNQT